MLHVVFGHGEHRSWLSFLAERSGPAAWHRESELRRTDDPISFGEYGKHGGGDMSACVRLFGFGCLVDRAILIK
jgi:hypothetical protein